MVGKSQHVALSVMHGHFDNDPSVCALANTVEIYDHLPLTISVRGSKEYISVKMLTSACVD